MSDLGRVHPLTVLQDTSGIPNYGAFLGTMASAEVISSINEQVGSTFFGTHYADTTAAFMQNFIVPLQIAAEQISTNVKVLLRPDVIRPLLREEDFAQVPASMQLPILLYAPVRDLFDRGRVEGFGFNPEYLPEEDVFAHILAAGRIEDVGAAMDANGVVKMNWTMWSDDPLLTGEEKSAIRDTREYIDRILANTSYDPTSWPNERG